MRYLAPVLALAVLFALALLLMRQGWRRRARDQRRIPAPHRPVRDGRAPTGAPLGRGAYVSTTFAGRPLERVVVHGLGMRSPVTVSDLVDGSTPALGLTLASGTVHIPWRDVESVHASPGMIGKWMGGDALVVIRWHLGEDVLDSGLRMDDRAGHDSLRARARELGIPDAPTPHLSHHEEDA